MRACCLPAMRHTAPWRPLPSSEGIMHMSDAIEVAVQRHGMLATAAGSIRSYALLRCVRLEQCDQYIATASCRSSIRPACAGLDDIPARLPALRFVPAISSAHDEITVADPRDPSRDHRHGHAVRFAIVMLSRLYSDYIRLHRLLLLSAPSSSRPLDLHQCRCPVQAARLTGPEGPERHWC